MLIKVGQFLSSRVDVLPPEFTHELEGLQDEVPCERFDDIRQIAEAEYGMPLGEKFASFDETPLAAASLGQVHRARLHESPWPDSPGSGQAVVVKILRPKIEKIIATDLAALRTVGGWLRHYRPISKRADVPALLAEFSRILYQEIDYLAEGHNAETFSANFKGRSNVRVPRVVWSHTTRRALTLEDVLAIKITNYQEITEAGIDRSEVASLLLDTYLQQIFEDGFFHADPHPGNLFVHPLEGQDSTGKRLWELTFVDFGMVGYVPAILLQGLQELLIAVGTQDAARVIKAYQMMDVLLPGADLALIEKAGAKVFERFWGKSMSELSAINIQEIQDFAGEFRELLYALPFQVPQDLIFLARCVGILSGMCTGLDPQFNLWEHLAPYAQKLIAEQAGGGLGVWLSELESLVRALLALPRRMDTTLSKMERGEIAVRIPEITEQVRKLERGLYQIASGVVFAALLLGGIQLYLAGQHTFSLVLFTGAGLDIIWMLLNPRSRY
ncbi:MAG: AarF/ABC1/UbiB kinase family protein [Anaerolineales bacterium]|nr:AarF/ABC1/UbiB kinase family protein [Anaerolineales bacterium]